MKPQPPSSLLPPNHEWRVVVAEHWSTERTGLHCTFDVGEGRHENCGMDTVATERAPAVNTHGQRILSNSPRCSEHLGSIRWVEQGVVYQWQAAPVPAIPGVR